MTLLFRSFLLPVALFGTLLCPCANLVKTSTFMHWKRTDVNFDIWGKSWGSQKLHFSLTHHGCIWFWKPWANFCWIKARDPWRDLQQHLASGSRTWGVGNWLEYYYWALYILHPFLLEFAWDEGLVTTHKKSLEKSIGQWPIARSIANVITRSTFCL